MSGEHEPLEPPAWEVPTSSSATPDVHAPFTAPAAAPIAAPRRRRRGATTAIVVLSVLLLGALGLGGYLWYAADTWTATSHEWEHQARANGQRVAELKAELEASTREVTSARDQLATATSRITELANEKAQLGDTNAVNQSLIDYQQRISEAAGNVAQALGRCTDGQGRLIEYMRTPERFDPDSLQNFADQVTALCQQATDANGRLQAELQR